MTKKKTLLLKNWQEINSVKRRKVDPEQLKKDLKTLEDETY